MNGNQGYGEQTRQRLLPNMLPPSDHSFEYGRSSDYNQRGNHHYHQNHQANQGNQEWQSRAAPNLDNLPPSSGIIEFGSDPSYGRTLPQAQVQGQAGTAPHQATEPHIQPVNGNVDEYDYDQDANWLNEIDLKEFDKIPQVNTSRCTSTACQELIP
jgi:hypothetical protein